jgi:transcriptional regulator with XRE-family HTH domain
MTPEEIKEFRNRRGLTQEGLAREIGVSVSTVQKWEGARARPRGLSLKALEQFVWKIDKAGPSLALSTRKSRSTRVGRTPRN